MLKEFIQMTAKKGETTVVVTNLSLVEAGKTFFAAKQRLHQMAEWAKKTGFDVVVITEPLSDFEADLFAAA